MEIQHGFAQDLSINVNDASFWKPNHFRLFLSHISLHKVRTSMLQKALLKYGISDFVAHEDIEPTKEWLIEIEKALFTMDALVAILTPEFNNSNWTDHEVGIAVGRGCLVVPIRKGKDPYGFIGKYQGFQAEGKTVEEVANGIFNILKNHEKTQAKMLDVLFIQFLAARENKVALWYLKLVSSVKKIPTDLLTKLRNNVLENSFILENHEVVKELNTLFKKYSLTEVSKESYIENEGIEENIPF